MAKPINLQPRINYPREAQAGARYLISVDLDHALPPLAWPYDGEEYPVTCFLDAAPAFTQEAAGDPTIVVHRYGGSYGPAQFWLTAGEPADATIRLTLVNGAGVPIAVQTLTDIKIVKSSAPLVVLVSPGVDDMPLPTRDLPRPAPERVFRWLQLGDLQFGASDALDDRPAVAEDLLHWLEQGQRIDAVIVAGDLVTAGRAEELKRAGTFLDALRSRLATAQGSWPGLLIVPGNHEAQKPMSSRARSDAVEWETNDQLRQRFWSDSSVPFRRDVDERFANYEEWRRLVESVGGNRRGILPGDFAVTIPLGDFRVGVVGLNDSFLIDPSDTRAPVDLDIAQLEAVCDGDIRSWADRHDLRILLTHHDPKHRPEIRERFDRDLAPRWLFDIRLYGSASAHTVLETFETASGISVGCSAARLGRRPGSRGYCVGEAHLSPSGLTVRVWPRVEESPGRMGPDRSLGVDDATGAISVTVSPRPAVSTTESEATSHGSTARDAAAAKDPADREPRMSTASVRNRYALLIGLNGCSDPTIPPMHYCVNDVTAVEALLKPRGYRIAKLIEKQATRAAILNAMQRACRITGDDDLIVLFFSGHAAQRKDGLRFLVSYDFSSVEESGVTLQQLTQIASERQRRLLIVGDAVDVPSRSTPAPGIGWIGGVASEDGDMKLGSMAAAIKSAFEQADSGAVFTIQQLAKAVKKYEHGHLRATAGLEVSPKQGAVVSLSREIADLALANPTSKAKASIRVATINVGVSDLDGIFPGLDRMLTQMNRVQAQFVFKKIKLKVPPDVWDPVAKQLRYLRAERFAERLTKETVTSSVQVLVCLTADRLRDDETVNLLSWWSDEPTPKIVLISWADLGVRAEDARSDRAFASALVTPLAAMLGNLSSHARGPKTCPLYFNPERSIELIVGKQAFDSTCRDKLHRAIPQQLPALERILGAFDRGGRSTAPHPRRYR